MPLTVKTYHELWQAVAEQVDMSRQSLGLSQDAYARRLGIAPNTLKRILTQGLMPNPEVAHRILTVHRGGTFEQAPKVRHRFRGGRRKLRQVPCLLTKDEWRDFQAMAKRMAISPGALATLAAQRMLQDCPPMVTIRHLVREIRLAEAKAALEANPELSAVLEMDPEIARTEAKRHPLEAHQFPVDHGGRMILRELATGSPPYDGPAVDLADLESDLLDYDDDGD